MSAESEPEPRCWRAQTARALPLGLCLGLFAWQLGLIQVFAVNFPFYDEWNLISPRLASAWPPLTWVFTQQNDSLIAPTRLQVWLLYHLDGWDLTTHMLLNFLLYGGLVALSAAHTARLGLGRMWAAAFALFLLSTRGWSNHAWAIQSCMHLWALGAVLGAAGLCARREGAGPRALGALGLALGVVSYAAGFVVALVVLLGWLALRGRLLGQTDRRQLALVLALVLPALLLWAARWHGSGEHDPVLPTQRAFWVVWLSLISSACGLDSVSPWAGLACLALILAPWVGLLRRRRPLPPQLAPLALVLGAGLAVAGTIALTRGQWGAAYAKESRYTTLSVLLVPYTAASWALWIREHPRRQPILAALWLALALAFSNDWGSAGYARLAERRDRGRGLARLYYLGKLPAGRPVRDPDVYPGRDLAPRLDTARELKLSWVAGVSGR